MLELFAADYPRLFSKERIHQAPSSLSRQPSGAVNSGMAGTASTSPSEGPNGISNDSDIFLHGSADRRCGMDPWLDVARGVGLVGLAAILVVVWFRYWGKGDPQD